MVAIGREVVRAIGPLISSDEGFDSVKNVGVGEGSVGAI